MRERNYTDYMTTEVIRGWNWTQRDVWVRAFPDTETCLVKDKLKCFSFLVEEKSGKTRGMLEAHRFC